MYIYRSMYLCMYTSGRNQADGQDGAAATGDEEEEEEEESGSTTNGQEEGLPFDPNQYGWRKYPSRTEYRGK